MSPPATSPEPTPAVNPASRRLRPGSTVILLLGAVTVSAPPTSLPESVLECVPCHHSGEMDQVGEWLASPYSASEGGLGCAGCHPAHCSGTEQNETSRQTTSIERLAMLRRALRLSLIATWKGSVVEAEVAVTNTGVGHHVPTGAAERSLVLEVVARDQDEEPLPPTTAPPSLAQPPRAICLAPFATDVSRHLFEAPEDGPVRVAARLLLVSADGPPIELANTTTLCRGSEATP